ncbi:MAG: sporulation protein YabP [Ruminiclostridium sp.]|nr:sporulation protein YabP [Ruminiclostridium sp.]
MSDHETSPHRLQLDSRQRLTIAGVDSVESFDESSILLTTSQGALAIRGSDLHIEKLSLDGGDLLVEGTVDALTYEEEDPRQGSFLSRLFRG